MFLHPRVHSEFSPVTGTKQVKMWHQHKMKRVYLLPGWLIKLSGWWAEGRQSRTLCRSGGSGIAARCLPQRALCYAPEGQGQPPLQLFWGQIGACTSSAHNPSAKEHVF